MNKVTNYCLEPKNKGETEESLILTIPTEENEK